MPKIAQLGRHEIVTKELLKSSFLNYCKLKVEILVLDLTHFRVIGIHPSLSCFLFTYSTNSVLTVVHTSNNERYGAESGEWKFQFLKLWVKGSKD